MDAVRIRPLLEQEHGKVVTTADDRQGEGVRPVPTRVIHIGPGVEQALRHRPVAVPHGKQERGEALGCAGADICTGRDEPLSDDLAAFGYRPHQSSLQTLVGPAIDVGSAGQQRLDDLNVSGASRHHQRRLTAGLRNVDVGTGREQSVDDRKAPILTGQREGGDPVIGAHVHVGAGLHQQFDQLEIVTVNRPVKRRRAVRPRRVDVDTIAQKSAHRPTVALRGGLDQLLAVGASRSDGGG